MNVLMVYAHQDPQSFGAAMHSRAVSFFEKRGDTVVISDLYGSGFHAVAAKWDFKVSGGAHQNYMLEQKRVADKDEGGFAEDIKQEVARLRAADLLVIEFPLWWNAAPAIMKGWFDKVFALGIVWDSDHRYDTGYLRGKKVLVVTGAGDAQHHYSVDGIHKATAEQYLYPLLHGTLAQAGLDVVQPYIAYNLTSAPKEEREGYLDALGTHLEKQFDSPSQYLYMH